MKQSEITRRGVLRKAMVGAMGITLEGANVGRAVSGSIKIEEPFHGAVLNRRHGKQVDGGLEIRVSGRAPIRDQVAVNGSPAQRAGDRFTSKVVLRQKEMDIIAQSQGNSGRHEHRVRVVWDKHSYPRYRFSIDDNSFFLRDIAKQNYSSLFDCFYLKDLRDLHKKYGVRFVLNIYYTTEDGFILPQFPDRYKSEWKDNVDWLKLAFHAYANKPDRPYQYASASKLIGDLDQVAEQIHRFAGEQSYSPPTVIHWGMVQPGALKPLYERGVRVLSGYFRPSSTGWDVNYLLDDLRSEYLSRHDALMDFDSGIVFSKIDIVCNTVPVERTVPTLESSAKDPNQAEIMDLFTHEQYFWPFYSHYLPDHFERLDVAIRWVTDRGYKPVFFHEGFMGGSL
ncbi:MAG: hypothetical protein JXM79_17650 [Sedimentisphaerales bacterium]|nr:hypothetical protein [Sedimentisphaerales bacterium]